MSGFEMFCERCGNGYGSDDPTASLPFARRLLMAVGVGEAPPPATDEPVLRFCLACRGYSCPACWNEAAGFCQTCVALPEPEVIAPETLPEPAFVFAAPAPMPEPQPEPFVVAEAAPEPVAVAETEPEPVPVIASEPEPPLPVFTFEDVAPEPEFDLSWDWSLDEAVVAVAETEPVMMAEPAPAPEPEPEAVPVIAMAPEPEPEAVPVVAMAPEPEPDAVPVIAAAPEPAPEPVIVAEPEPPSTPAPLWPPVFRPLEPIGPIVPPPPPAPANRPQITFDLPEPAPSFLFARQPTVQQHAPMVPAGLFDGPAPSIRPCPQCELPVSAKARFCRRCGSAQS
jgi:hypothetical protein